MSTADFLATLTAIPLAFAIYFVHFRGKQALITLVNSLISLVLTVNILANYFQRRD